MREPPFGAALSVLYSRLMADAKDEVCERCGEPLEAHNIFNDEPTPEQLEGLSVARFRSQEWIGVYCPSTA
jgi:hypothetical protein